jgi:hypothetical protein
VYTPEEELEKLVRWITVNDVTFNVVDDPNFREMIHTMNPAAVVPSKDTIRREIDRRFGEEKKRVRSMLQGVPGRLSFAVDAWTSPNMRAFLGITVHWIDADWELRSLLLDMAPLVECSLNATRARTCAAPLRTPATGSAC